MATSNGDLVRRILSEWQRGDYRSREWADPKIVFSIIDGPSPGTWHGIDGMVEGWRGFLHSWQTFQGGELEKLQELGGGRVLVHHGFYGRGKTSGLEIEAAGSATIFDIRDGKVTRLRVYFDRDRAAEDLADGG